ncbi:MAG TPA: hypothetical protein VM936_12040 [Pyrinomonadaceae bacterium]|jgi:hypothetical protein|nr:hypothetical protein [Pyrinomonadaceae bacterium]
MSCGCGCGGHGGCGDARAYAPRRRRPYYTGSLRRRGYEPEYMAAPAPAFGARVSFAAALANPAANSAGLYRIYKDGRPVYAGRAAPGTIRSRLVNHRWCLTHMGVGDSAYTVSFAPMGASSTAQVVAAEKNEIRRMRRNRVHRGTNVREGEYEGEQIFGRIRDWWNKRSQRPPQGQSPPPSQPPGGPYRTPGEEPPPSSRPSRPPAQPAPPSRPPVAQPGRPQRDSDYGWGPPPSSRR